MATRLGEDGAVRLLGEIAAWEQATGCTAGKLGAMVLNHPGFAPLLRKRLTLQLETADRMRGFMAAFPTRESLPDGLVEKLVNEARAGVPWEQGRHRALLIRLGFAALVEPAVVEGGATGGKPRVSASVIRAAKVDGRDLPTFVTALIDMGLECWRDDRVVHGEALA